MLSLALGLFVQDSKFPIEITDVPESAALVYRHKDEGFAYFSEQSLTLVANDGRKESTYSVPVGQKPLFYWKERGLITCSEIPLKTYSLQTGKQLYAEYPLSGYFASREAVFMVGGGLTLIDPRAGLHFPNMTSYSTASISADWKTVVFFHCLDVRPTLVIANWGDGEWLKSQHVQVPIVDRVGMVSTLFSHPDMVFVSKDCVAFIGEFVGPVNERAYEEMKSRLPDFSKWPLSSKPQEFLNPYEVDVFLFVMRIPDGLVIPYGRFKQHRTPERGYKGGYGRMVPSGDDKALYLLADKKVLRFDMAKLARSFSVD